MADTTTVKLLRSYGIYNAGERAGFTEEELDDMADHVFKRVNTQASSESKSDPDVREKLKAEARAKKALESDDYNKMRSTLSKLDKPTTGTKDALRDRLEDIVES